MMKRRMHTTFAAINLGSEKISMQITEYRGMSQWKLLDACERPLRLGEATFKRKSIPLDMVNEICEILVGFKRLMDEYGVDEYKLDATTAVREATNQVFLLDQIYSRTGLTVDVVDLPQEIYIKYVAIRNTLKEEKITSMDGAMLMMDISSGGLGITLVDNNQIKYQENMHVGIIRIKESFDRNKRESLHFNTALTEYLSSTIGPVRTALKGTKARYLVISGIETRLLLRLMQQNTQAKVHRIKAEDFQEFFNKVCRFNLPQLMSIYKITENEAELVLPMLVMYERLLKITTVEEIIVTDDSFIEGMQLLHIGMATNKTQFREWQEELHTIFHMLGRRYSYDQKHAEQVERLALQIFDEIAPDYGMGAKERLLLQGTAIMHDIGKFVCLRSHTAYSYELIMNSDLLGFSDHNKQIMALAAYYHANNLFEGGRKNGPVIPKEDMAIVAKLAAIVRLADAMDRSYEQKIKGCRVYLKEQTLLLEVQSKLDLSLESWAFDRKAEFFEEVYGLKPVLERVDK